MMKVMMLMNGIDRWEHNCTGSNSFSSVSMHDINVWVIVFVGMEVTRIYVSCYGHVEGGWGWLYFFAINIGNIFQKHTQKIRCTRPLFPL